MERRTLRTLRCDCGRRSLLFATAAERFRRENTWVLVLNSSGPNGPMNQREVYHEAINIKDEESEKWTQDSIPVSKFDNDQVNHLHGTMKEMKEPTPETGWRWYFFNSLIKLIFDVLEIIWKMVAGVELGWTVFFFSSQCQRVELTSSGDSLVSDEGCKHYTKPTHTSHSRTRDFFLAWLKTWVIESTGIVVSLRKVVLTLSTACRTRPRCCFPHTWALPHFPHALPSDLLSDLRCCPLHTEIYPARIYRMCLSAPWLDHTRLQVVSPRISLKRTPFFVKPMFFHRPRMTSGQRKRTKLPFLTYQRMVFPSAIRNKTGGKRICCRFRTINAHDELERP